MLNIVVKPVAKALARNIALIDESFRMIFGKSSQLSDRIGTPFVLLVVTVIHGIWFDGMLQLFEALEAGQSFQWQFRPESVLIIGVVFMFGPWLLKKYLQFLKALPSD